ncbi:unnamed protein product [Cylicocyclus nassatus]|uniref:Serpentine receptor class gamma n=1 Tax=Cylicocyclus nassatus TaxID=53992 RepID=A0AA36DRB8_CYLNA|nr:unnamed protein product [Cylicocyclus nassatus]
MWFLFQNIYGAISIMLYAIVVYLLFRERQHFNRSFLALFIIFAIVSISNYIALYISLRLPMATAQTSPIAPILKSLPQLFLRLVVFLCYYLPFCINATELLFIFNQYRAIAFPFAKDYPFEVLISILIIFLPPLPLSYNLLLVEASFIYREFIQGYFLMSGGGRDDRKRLLYLVIFECAVAVLGLILNLVAGLMLKRTTSVHNRRVRKRIYLVSCICFAFQVLNAVVTLCVYLLGWHSSALVLTIRLYPFCYDLNSLTPPYYFLLINRRIKRSFFNLPLCKRIASLRNSITSTMTRDTPVIGYIRRSKKSGLPMDLEFEPNARFYSGGPDDKAANQSPPAPFGLAPGVYKAAESEISDSFKCISAIDGEYLVIDDDKICKTLREARPKRPRRD